MHSCISQLPFHRWCCPENTASRLEHLKERAQAPMSVLAAKFNTLSSYDLDFEGVHSGRKRKQQGLGRVISGHPNKVSIL